MEAVNFRVDIIYSTLSGGGDLKIATKKGGGVRGEVFIGEQK